MSYLTWNSTSETATLLKRPKDMAKICMAAQKLYIPSTIYKHLLFYSDIRLHNLFILILYYYSDSPIGLKTKRCEIHLSFHFFFFHFLSTPSTENVMYKFTIQCIPYARHYNPRFVYFLPTFSSPKTFFQGAFFLKFWPYVWLVFKSGF